MVVDLLQWADKSALPIQVGLAALPAANAGATFTAGSGSELPTDGWKSFTNPDTGSSE